MSKENTKLLLKKLHQELQNPDTLVDSELQGLLHNVESDIMNILIKQEIAKTEEEKDNLQSDSSKLSSKIDDLMTRFAVDHPRAEGILQDLAETLHKMGI